VYHHTWLLLLFFTSQFCFSLSLCLSFFLVVTCCHWLREVDFTHPFPVQPSRSHFDIKSAMVGIFTLCKSANYTNQDLVGCLLYFSESQFTSRPRYVSICLCLSLLCFFLFFFLAVLEFKLRASCLLGTVPLEPLRQPPSVFLYVSISLSLYLCLSLFLLPLPTSFCPLKNTVTCSVTPPYIGSCRYYVGCPVFHILLLLSILVPESPASWRLGSLNSGVGGGKARELLTSAATLSALPYPQPQSFQPLSQRLPVSDPAPTPSMENVGFPWDGCRYGVAVAVCTGVLLEVLTLLLYVESSL
jgi:hypothetical protein